MSLPSESWQGVVGSIALAFALSSRRDRMGRKRLQTCYVVLRKGTKHHHASTHWTSHPLTARWAWDDICTDRQDEAGMMSTWLLSA